MDAGGFPLIEFLHGPLHGPLNGLATLDASSFPNGLLDALGRAWPIAWTGLWMGGLAATILAVVVAGLARTAAMRPATRHALWLAVLVSFLTPPLVATVWRPTWFASERKPTSEPVVPASTNAAPKHATPTSALAGNDAAVPETSTTRGDSSSRTPPSPAATGDAGPSMLGMSSELQSACGNAPIATEPNAVCATTPGSVCEPIASETEQCTWKTETLAGIVPPPSATAPTAKAPATPVTEPLLAASLTASPVAPSSPSEKTAAEHANEPGLAGTAAVAEPSALRLWFARVVDIRDAIAALPPMPAVLWASGTLLVIAIHITRVVRVRRILRRAMHATPEVQREVDQVARSVGLEHAPITLISNERISPLVWCGMRSHLVLPADLWESLDRAARRTVLVHELAHVRRGDHRICWLEAVVAALYWWHPIAWWARARLRDAAETACDTWVTAVCPQNRRSYAEALVLATSFLSSTTDRSARAQSAACAAVSVGFVTGRSRRLARRITMVMTSRFAPRMSLVGTAACLLALGMGAFVAPSLACPPSQCDEDVKAAAEAKAVLKARDKARASSRAATAPRASSPFQGEAPAIDAMGTAPSSAGGPAFGTTAPRARGVLIAPDTVAVPGMPVVPGTPVVAGHPLAQGFPLAVIAGEDGEIIQRSYSLPEGKLDALIELMSRDDVPIFIQNRGDSILVNATAGQHEIFGAFVQMIHPSKDGAEPGAGQSLNGSNVRQGQRYRVDAIGPNSSNGVRGALPGGRVAGQQLRMNELGQLKVTKQQLQQLLRERDRIERDAERLHESAEEARERAEAIRESFSQLEEQRSNLSRFGDATAEQSLMDAMRALESRAHAFEAEADSMESKAGNTEARMQMMEASIHDLEVRLEQLANALESAGLSAADDMTEVEGIDLAATDAMEAMEALEAIEAIEAIEETEEVGSGEPVDEVAAPTPAPASAPTAPAPATIPAPPAPPVAPAGAAPALPPSSR